MGARCGRILYQLDDFVAQSSSSSSEGSGSSGSKKRTTSLIGKNRPFALYDDRPLTRGQAIEHIDDSAEMPDEWGRHSSFSRLRPEARRGRATVPVSPHTTTDNIQEDDDEEMAAKILQDFLDGHFANAAGDDDFLGLSGRSTATARKTLTAAVPKRGPSTHTLRSSIDNESERAYISPSLL